MDPIVITIAAGLVIAAVGAIAIVVRQGATAATSYGRRARTAEDLVTPDVAAALERRTIRRGRLRLSDEPGGGYRDAPGTEGAD